MREGVLFAKLGLCLVSHHRVLSVRPDMRAACFGLYAYAIVFSRANDLDGFVPDGAIDQLAGTDDMVECLVRVGLLARHEKDGVHGFLIHKYSEFNETRAQTTKRLKAQNKWKSDSRGRAKDNTHVRPDKALTSPLTSGLGQALVRPSETETESEIKISPVVPSPGIGPSNPVAVAKGTKQRTSKPGTQVPADGDHDGMAAWCMLWGIPHDHPKLGRMLDWARAKGIVRKDWMAQWRNWLNSPFADTETARHGVFRTRDGGSSQEDPYEVQQRVKRRDRIDLMAEIHQRLGLVQGGKQ